MEQPGNKTLWSNLVARTKSQRPFTLSSRITVPIQNFPRVIRANSRRKKEWNRKGHVTSHQRSVCHFKHAQSSLFFRWCFADIFICCFSFRSTAVRIYVSRRIACAWLCINPVPRILRFYLLHLPLFVGTHGWMDFHVHWLPRISTTTLLHYTTLHYLHCTALQLQLHYLTLDYITLYHTTLHNTTRHYAAVHYTKYTTPRLQLQLHLQIH